MPALNMITRHIYYSNAYNMPPALCTHDLHMIL